MDEHYGPETADDPEKDWCEVCQSVTRYEGEVCQCCGRVWGRENGTCKVTGHTLETGTVLSARGEAQVTVELTVIGAIPATWTSSKLADELTSYISDCWPLDAELRVRQVGGASIIRR